MPFPKNPVIGAFFREIHRADELGSGMRNMMKYGQAYGGEDPQMIEGDVFRIIVTVPEFGAVEKKSKQEVNEQKIPTGEVTGEVAGEVQRLIQSIRGEMSRAEIQREMKLN